MKFKILLSFFIFLFFIDNIRCQETSKSIVKYNLRLNSFYDFQVKRDYNYRMIQFAPASSIEYKNHSFYFGPLYVHFFQPIPIAGEIFEKYSYGLNFGYRYYTNYFYRNGRLFGQFNYSIFQIKSKQYQLGPPFQTDSKKIFAENTVAIGMDLKILRNFICSSVLVSVLLTRFS